ncbi:hypothetical protein CC80DRAFT_540560 [Byssothecium circinans]|uniref:Uncharacterized protein n=1 Tax=Byssothecium circinans TaxID=147558 RepID=A0A6A5TEA8_9PLEO|nr:hypothetical protein CC80DRAFT_540560 [Byssothecium circinans]
MKLKRYTALNLNIAKRVDRQGRVKLYHYRDTFPKSALFSRAAASHRTQDKEPNNYHHFSAPQPQPRGRIRHPYLSKLKLKVIRNTTHLFVLSSFSFYNLSVPQHSIPLPWWPYESYQHPRLARTASAMCYYRVYIFEGCGHRVLSANPVRQCGSAVAAAREVLRRAAEERTRGRRGRGWRSVAEGGNGGVECGSEGNRQGNDRIPETTAIPTTRVGQNTSQDQDQGPGATTVSSSQTLVSPPPPSTTTTSFANPCRNIQTHPFQTTIIERTCLLCTQDREYRLHQSASGTPQVRFEDWRWKVKYLSPTVPEEPSHTNKNWGLGAGVGGVMGSLAGKGREVLDVLREQVGAVQSPSSALRPASSRSSLSLRGSERFAGRGEEGSGGFKAGLKGRGKRKHAKSWSEELRPSLGDAGEWRREARAKSEDVGKMGLRGGLTSS